MKKKAESALSKFKNFKKEESPVPFLAFTYFYAVSIFLLLIAFFYWLWYKEDE